MIQNSKTSLNQPLGYNNYCALMQTSHRGVNFISIQYVKKDIRSSVHSQRTPSVSGNVYTVTECREKKSAFVSFSLY